MLPTARDEPWSWAAAGLALVASLSQIALFASFALSLRASAAATDLLSHVMATAVPVVSIGGGIAALVARSVSARELWKTRRWPHPALTAVVVLLGGGSVLAGLGELALYGCVRSLGRVSGPF